MSWFICGLCHNIWRLQRSLDGKQKSIICLYVHTAFSKKQTELVFTHPQWGRGEGWGYFCCADADSAKLKMGCDRPACDIRGQEHYWGFWEVRKVEVLKIKDKCFSGISRPLELPPQKLETAASTNKCVCLLLNLKKVNREIADQK